MRISLRFELMCLDASGIDEDGKDERFPSIALKKIRSLSRLGSHEDHNMKSSISTPQLMGYFGNMLY
jgi:rhamnose utilization protein RhaD (predicted bifunctional aldolase and dehydrogenase)